MDLTGVTLLGKYEVEKPLGEGGMGAVWLGRHKLLGRTVAIKVLDDRFLNHPEVVERFGREARAASAIQHPGIVEVLDIDKTDTGIPFLVMELLSGEPLADRIERVGRMSEKDAVEVITQLLEALDAAHAAGIVHRDLKPDNVFLVPRGRGGENVKILDFGISHKSDEQGMKLTMEGSVLGTPHYMSPEQAMGKKEIDLRADIYAAGVLFYECLTGEVPFDAENYNALILKILSEQARSPSELGVNLDPMIEGTLMSAIAKDRDLRPRTCQQMLEMLRGERSPTVPIANKSVVADVPDLDMPVPEDNLTLPSGSLEPPAQPSSNAQPRARKRSTAVQDLFRSSQRRSSPGEEGERLSLDIAIGKGAQPADADVLALDPELDPPDPGSSPAVTSGPAPGSISGPAREPKPLGWGTKALLVGVIVAGLMLAVITVIKVSNSREDEPGIAGAQGTAQAPVATPTPVKSKMVELTLRGLPAGAKVKLNGFPVATFPLRVPRGKAQEIEVGADGYRVEKLTFTAHEDKVLPIRLQRETHEFQKLEVPVDPETEDSPADGEPANEDSTDETPTDETTDDPTP